jgi:hypothetical protein
MKPSGRKEAAAAARKCAVRLFFCQARKIFCVAMWKGAKCMKSDRGTFHRGEFVLIGYLFNLHPQPEQESLFVLETCHFIFYILRYASINLQLKKKQLFSLHKLFFAALHSYFPCSKVVGCKIQGNTTYLSVAEAEQERHAKALRNTNFV